jgi:four helix bundle protein
MGGINRFEDIDAWKEARILTQQIHSHTDQAAFGKDIALREQIRRAVLSIMANIAEGFDAGSDREFLRFLRYALRSTSEVQSHLYVALDRGCIESLSFHESYE